MTSLLELPDSPPVNLRGQVPLFLSHDAIHLLQWARHQPDYRDAFSREPRSEQIERITIGPREGYTPSPYYPNRLRQSWFYNGQWCQRHVAENLGWDEDRHRSARDELRNNGYARENGWFAHELTELGWELAIPEPDVVPV